MRCVDAEGKNVREFPVAHTFNEEQIEWFKAGSALNYMKHVNAAKTRSGVA